MHDRKPVVAFTTTAEVVTDAIRKNFKGGNAIIAFVNVHNIQCIFRDADNDAYINLARENYNSRDASIKGREAITKFLTFAGNENGFTNAANHVVVVDNPELVDFSNVTPGETVLASERVLRGGPPFPRNMSDEAGPLVTLMHELGHQVHYKAGLPAKPKGAKSLTRYSLTNYREWFAEHFALYAIDPEAYRAKHLTDVSFIEATLAKALTAPKRRTA